MDSQSTQSAAQWYDQGVCCLEHSHFCRAEAIATQGLAEHPDHGQLWQLLGVARWARKEYINACEALEMATMLTPLQPLAQCALAECYLELEQTEAARTILFHLADYENDFPEILSKVARGLGRLNEHELALDVCKKITAFAPTYHPAWFGIAFYLARLERNTEEALYALQQALQLAPHSLVYRLNLGFVKLSLGQFQEAYAVLKHVPIEQVQCEFWIRHMRKVFEVAGDEFRVEQCVAQLAILDENVLKEGNQ